MKVKLHYGRAIWLLFILLMGYAITGNFWATFLIIFLATFEINL